MSWNVGNTSVRNPWRIQSGLGVFAKGFNGNLDGNAQEALFLNRLVAEGIVESRKTETEAMAWHGRKWRSCFCKLGFATAKKYRVMAGGLVSLSELKSQNLGFGGRPYELTPAGRRLLDAGSEPAVADVFLRQLLRLEIASPVEQEPDRVRIKPLVLLLQILKSLEDKEEPGLNLVEIAGFVQTATNHGDYEERVERILAYRREREQRDGYVRKRAFDNETIVREHAAAGIKVKAENLIDYADTKFRYCRMSGLLSLRGNRLSIREETRLLVEEILEVEPQFLAQADPLLYLVDFYKGTAIPTDQESTALEEIRIFEEKLTEHGLEPVARAATLVGRSSQDLALARHNVERQYLLAVESDFAKSHAENDQEIDEVVTYLKALSGVRGLEVTIEEKPPYLEWSVWRALLLFNRLAVEPHLTRNFQLDADLRPVACASSGKPDITMTYPDFMAVVEVTMKGGSRQEAAEGEPVRRHVANVFLSTSNKEVYGIFVAPAIDDNTAETFRAGIWYHNGEPTYLNIVPLNLDQLIRIVESFKTKRRTPKDLKALLDRCLVFRNLYAPRWLDQIERETSSWVSASAV